MQQSLCLSDPFFGNACPAGGFPKRKNKRNKLRETFAYYGVPEVFVKKRKKAAASSWRSAGSVLSAFPYMSIYIRRPGFCHQHPRTADGIFCSSGLLKQSFLRSLFYRKDYESSNSTFRYAESVEISGCFC